MEKLVITVATTGAWPGKKDTPYVPLQPREIADEVYRCWKAGAAIAHIHVRDDEGLASMSFEKFKDTVGLIRERCDIILNLTTSGGLGVSDEDRMRPFMELKPEMASFDAGSMNWAHSAVFLNTPSFLEKLGKTMQEYGVKPELEIFDAGMVYNTLYYLEKGVLKEPLHFQFVLGAPGGIAATVENLVFLKGLIPQNATWSAFGIGKMHLPILLTSLALGATGVRVGMEDNIFYSKSVLAKSNVEFVERVKRLASEIGREIATPDEARNILGLRTGGQKT